MSAAEAIHVISAQRGVCKKRTVEPNRRTSAKEELPRKVTRGVVITDAFILKAMRGSAQLMALVTSVES